MRKVIQRPKNANKRKRGSKRYPEYGTTRLRKNRKAPTGKVKKQKSRGQERKKINLWQTRARRSPACDEKCQKHPVDNIN